MSTEKKHLLLVTQVYLPDPTSVGQHMAHAAEEMARRGWRVTVITSGSGYDDPSLKFPPRETLNGVEVVRLPFSSFGKKSIAHRLVGQGLFCLQAILRGLFLKKLDSILVTTSPPVGGMVGWLLSVIRGIPFNFWAMDLNPDQAIAQGIVSESSLPAKIFNGMNRLFLKRASAIVALDRFMAANLEKKVQQPISDKIHLIPPWPIDEALEIIPKAENPFLKEHGFEDRFVLMYSGNHSVVHPLVTFLEASRQLRDDDRILFAFVGGGKAKQQIDDLIAKENPTNILSLPYQPLDQIKYSLSAADVHLVSMGEPMIGCVHPCKVYGAMSLAKPILYLGPKGSHIGELLGETQMGWQVDHGDTGTMIRTLREVAALTPEELDKRGQRGLRKIQDALSQDKLCGDFCDAVGQG